ncbi:MAG: PD-(D/E)XK nuclease family protein [Betaproteobacteria bacterium]
MITPRTTRLVRVPHLPAFRIVSAALSVGGGLSSTRARVVVVPTRGAARQLRATIENAAARPAVVLPDFATRDELYDRLHARLAAPPRRLSPFEREAMMHAAARASEAAGAPPPFKLRPGLIAEIVRFYDQLRRQGQSVSRFDELLAEALERDAEFDRGAERMLAQTRFLAAVFRAYEERIAEAGTLDEHALRQRLVREEARDPIRHAVITVADWIADPNGLFQSDFDLLTRIPGLASIDIVATERLLGSGFHQRVHDWLPGIEEVDGTALCAIETRAPAVLAVPPEPRPGPVFVSRDREEELVAVARRLGTARVRKGPACSDADRTAVVFRRPLPYLYLARSVFGGARIPYRTLDALPLAAEPIAAALDLAIEAASSQFSRDALVALLRSPHFDLSSGRAPVTLAAVAALDRALSEARYLGDVDRLRELAADWDGDDRRAPARTALMSALAAAGQLQPLGEPAPASVQLGRIVRFLETFGRAIDQDDPEAARHLRARAAVIGLLRGLAAARAAFDDPPVTIDDIAPDIRRWIEEETFAPAVGGSGVHLLDSQAARYGDFDDVTIVGLVEGEWPERPRRNIFYPPALLASLGWPPEKDRRAAATAAFLDLLWSSSARVALSTFTLDDEALVERSSLVDEVPAAGLSIAEEPPPAPARVFVEEALSLAPVALDVLGPLAREWARLRLARTDGSDARYHGAAGSQPLRPLPVSAIETYLSCPFKFFAQRMLRLEEEPEDEEVMDPRRQGRFVHAVFESFFDAWQARGNRAITPDNLDAARALFEETVEEHLLSLPDAEAALERTRLLGSSVAAGLGEVVFRMEAERPMEVVERLLEFPLEGDFDFECPDGPRRIALRGVADRIDLLGDRTMRLIDYKLSSAPSRSRALQLPIYGICAEQRLRTHAGGPWRLGEAAYIAFRGSKRVTPLFTTRTSREEALADAQARLVKAVDGIAAGAFPPTPTDVFICGYCSYAAVCRKDYVGDV